jgi:hypothetical protein
MVRRPDTTTSTVRVAEIEKKAARAGGRMALEVMVRVATQTMMVLDACAEKDHPAVTARHEMAKKAAGIDVRKVRRVAMDHHRVMAIAVNTGLAPTVRHTHQGPVPIGHIRPARPMEMRIGKKAPKSPPPLSDLSS